MIADFLFKKNPDLPNMRNWNGQLPIHYTAMLGKKHMVQYLLKITKEDVAFEGNSGSHLLGDLITSGLYGE